MKQEVPASFNLTETRFGRDMRLYVEAGAFVKKKTENKNVYETDAETLRGFLKAKGWWVEL